MDGEDREQGQCGVKGLGEIVHVGGVSAITHAVLGATGRRVRELPTTASMGAVSASRTSDVRRWKGEAGSGPAVLRRARSPS